MTFDAEAYAEGISNEAAGSTIEVLVMAIDNTIEAINDAIAYRMQDHDPDEQDSVDDKETADVFQGTGEEWLALRAALVAHAENTDLTFPDPPVITG